MSASLKVWGACRSLAVRARPAVPKAKVYISSTAPRRWYADEPNKTQSSPNQPQKPDKSASQPVSEAPVANPLDAMTTAEEGVPEALGDEALEQLFYGERANPQDTEGGLTPAQEEHLYLEGSIPAPSDAENALAALPEETSMTTIDEPPAMLGHKFALPMGPFDREFHLKKRYHPVMEQLTRLLMRDGKLSVAQRNMSIIMNHLRTSPAPIYSPKFPLLPGTPPPSHLPLNPILYITIAIDSVAPIIRMSRIAGGAGGGRALEFPVPVALRQRRRTAFQWIMESVKSKPSKGSGRKQFPQRVAEELIAVVEGRSSVWDKRRILHKQGTANRSNVGAKSKKSGLPG